MTVRDHKLFTLVAGLAIGVKVWLTSSIAINPYFGPHDATNFLEHAKAVLMGDWFGAYNDLTLIKGPGLPLYLASIRQLGIPLPLAHQLIYSLAALTACLAIRPLVRRAWILCFVFLVLLFNPATFANTAWVVNRSQVVDTLVLLVIASAIGAVVRVGAPLPKLAAWLAVLGASVTALWLTREDTIWIFPALAVFLGAYLWGARTHCARKQIGRAALIVIPILIFGAGVATIMLVNGSVYGWKTTVETTSPEFVSAYQSLTRIVIPGKFDRQFPAPRAARELAYGASDAAAELRPFLDPARGLTGWEQLSCGGASFCNDVGAGFFLWALRDAVASAGYYASGQKARAFYVRFSQELDAACDAGRLTCRRKGHSLAPPIYLSDIPSILRFAGEAFWSAVTFNKFALGGPDPNSSTDGGLVEDYEFVTGSGAFARYGYHGWYQYQGWLLRNPGSILELQDPLATDVLKLDVVPSPDVRSVFSGSREFKNDDLDHARFSILTSCERDCFLSVEERSGRTYRIPLEASQTDFSKPGLRYHLDSIAYHQPYSTQTNFKVEALEQIALAYQQVVPWWLGAALLALALRCLRFVRKRQPKRTLQYLFIITGIVVSIASLCSILGIVSAVSFNVLQPEYEVPLLPLLLLWLAFETAVEGEVALRWFIRCIPSRKAAAITLGGN